MNSSKLAALGWKDHFQHQLSDREAVELLAVRVAAHLGSQILCMTTDGELTLPAGPIESCGDVAVGDWLLLDPVSHRAHRRLARTSLIARKGSGEKVRSQLIAANLDTVFVVSSCNHDFNRSRLERYLAMATEAQVTPVVVLTKSDLCDDTDLFRQQAAQLMTELVVVTLDARDNQQAGHLTRWCGIGQTVALVGSSGVGKSTLAMAMGVGRLETQEIREDDSKGRHTTTVRSIHQLASGGLLIDTPGMRELQLSECDEGVAGVFEDIVALARLCQFRDCSHGGEPGCAVQASIEAGETEARRLKNYLKLHSEQARNAKSLRERRHESRKLGQFYKSVQAQKRRRRDG